MTLFVANTEPGYYPAANRSAYAYLFWDAYFKGLLPKEAEAVAQNMRESKSADEKEFELGRWLNSYLYFNDLWTDVSYQLCVHRLDVVAKGAFILSTPSAAGLVRQASAGHCRGE